MIKWRCSLSSDVYFSLVIPMTYGTITNVTLWPNDHMTRRQTIVNRHELKLRSEAMVNARIRSVAIYIQMSLLQESSSTHCVILDTLHCVMTPCRLCRCHVVVDVVIVLGTTHFPTVVRQTQSVIEHVYSASSTMFAFSSVSYVI